MAITWSFTLSVRPWLFPSFVHSFSVVCLCLYFVFTCHTDILSLISHEKGACGYKKTIILIRISESIYLQMTSRPQFSLEKLSRGKNKNYFVFAFCHKQKTTTAVAARKISQQPIEIAQLLQLLINYYNNIYK